MYTEGGVGSTGVCTQRVGWGVQVYVHRGWGGEYRCMYRGWGEEYRCMYTEGGMGSTGVCTEGGVGSTGVCTQRVGWGVQVYVHRGWGGEYRAPHNLFNTKLHTFRTLGRGIT